MLEQAPDLNSREVKTVESVEAGVAELIRMAEQVHSANDRKVLVVISGEPNSGKTYFSKQFQNQTGALYLVGLETDTERYTDMPNRFIIVEEIGNRTFLQTKAKNNKKSIDLYIYIYDPLVVKYISTTDSKEADLIIRNSDSKIK